MAQNQILQVARTKREDFVEKLLKNFEVEELSFAAQFGLKTKEQKEEATIIFEAIFTNSCWKKIKSHGKVDENPKL